MFTHVAARMARWPPTRPFQAVLQPIRYLLDRSLCFRPEREWPGRAFTDGSTVPLQGTHNNHDEQQIRPWATGRKNWLFAGTLAAGQRAAVITSLIQSAKLNGHDPYVYLSEVLQRLPTQRASEIEQLLPHRWSPPA